jgi:hypothetical protein
MRLDSLVIYGNVDLCALFVPASEDDPEEDALTAAIDAASGKDSENSLIARRLPHSRRIHRHPQCRRRTQNSG